MARKLRRAMGDEEEAGETAEPHAGRCFIPEGAQEEKAMVQDAWSAWTRFPEHQPSAPPTRLQAL
jgi:hypothetical protein